MTFKVTVGSPVTIPAGTNQHGAPPDVDCSKVRPVNRSAFAISYAHHHPWNVCLRYCARPPFALEHLHTLDAEHLLYHNPKPRSDSPRDLVLTPLELIDKIAALLPQPRAHRHRYYGVLAPNSPLRAAVTAMAPLPVIVQPLVEATEADAPTHSAASHYLWAMLLARIYEMLPLVCPLCQSPMRIIAFITEASTVRKILNHLGESTLPPCIAPARGPPLWELEQAPHRQAGNDVQWDSTAQPEPVFEFDQRGAW